MPALDRTTLHRLFTLLDEELRAVDARGEIYLVGGAVMCLAYQSRPSTQDVDGWFRPAREVREAAARVASNAEVDAAWLNDGVKGFLSERGDFSNYLELQNLRVMVASPEYLLAMKCLAMRIGPEFHDEDDIRYLLRHLGVTTFSAAKEIITRYYPLERFPQKTMYALSEILA
jgi:hypothetical protein